MCLVTTSQTGKNFNAWSKSICIVLDTKSKLGFIDGTCNRPYNELDELD